MYVKVPPKNSAFHSKEVSSNLACDTFGMFLHNYLPPGWDIKNSTNSGDGHLSITFEVPFTIPP